MNEYRIKIGNLYVNDIYTNEECVKTYFIESITLGVIKNNGRCFKVDDKQKESFRGIMKNILGLENEYSEIQFEKIEEGEKYE